MPENIRKRKKNCWNHYGTRDMWYAGIIISCSVIEPLWEKETTKNYWKIPESTSESAYTFLHILILYPYYPGWKKNYILETRSTIHMQETDKSISGMLSISSAHGKTVKSSIQFENNDFGSNMVTLSSTLHSIVDFIWNFCFIQFTHSECGLVFHIFHLQATWPN